jgi:hypothetical protein
MNDATEDEMTPLVVKPSRTLYKIDRRTSFQRNLAVCLILLSTGFERLAFYSLAGNLTFFLDSKLIHWTFPHTIIAPFIFLGKIKKIFYQKNILYFKKVQVIYQH